METSRVLGVSLTAQWKNHDVWVFVGAVEKSRFLGVFLMAQWKITSFGCFLDGAVENHDFLAFS